MIVNLHQSPPTPLSPWVPRGWKQALKRKQHIRPKKLKWQRTLWNDNASIFNNAKTMCQRGKREIEDGPRKLGKVSHGKGMAAGQFWTASTTSEPLLRRRESMFQWVNEGLPLIAGSHTILAQGLPSLLHPGALHACFPTVLPLPHQDPFLPPTTTGPAWHLLLVFFCFPPMSFSPLIWWALLFLRREVGKEKSHWPLIISTKDYSPKDNCLCWLSTDCGYPITF